MLVVYQVGTLNPTQYPIPKSPTAYCNIPLSLNPKPYPKTAGERREAAALSVPPSGWASPLPTTSSLSPVAAAGAGVQIDRCDHASDSSVRDLPSCTSSVAQYQQGRVQTELGRVREGEGEQVRGDWHLLRMRPCASALESASASMLIAMAVMRRVVCRRGGAVWQDCTDGWS
eukprot:3155186-Rhodomonas_salina.2